MSPKKERAPAGSALEGIIAGRREFRCELLHFLKGLDEAWRAMPADMTGEARSEIIREATRKFLAELERGAAEYDRRAAESRAAQAASHANADTAKELALVKQQLREAESVLLDYRTTVEDNYKIAAALQADMDEAKKDRERLNGELRKWRAQVVEYEKSLAGTRAENLNLSQKIKTIRTSLEALKGAYYVSNDDLDGVLKQLR